MQTYEDNDLLTKRKKGSCLKMKTYKDLLHTKTHGQVLIKDKELHRLMKTSA